jgi:hypothetical protein
MHAQQQQKHRLSLSSHDAPASVACRPKASSSSPFPSADLPARICSLANSASIDHVPPPIPFSCSQTSSAGHHRPRAPRGRREWPRRAPPATTWVVGKRSRERDSFPPRTAPGSWSKSRRLPPGRSWPSIPGGGYGSRKSRGGPGAEAVTGGAR